MIKSASEIREAVRRILLAAGADERNACRVAEAMVGAHLSGVDSHGVVQLPLFVDHIKAGYIVPTAWPEILSETSTSALISGNWTFGHVTAKYAMDVAIEKASQQTVAVAAIVQTHGIGRLGEYTELAASKRMIGMMWAGGYGYEAPWAFPFGGRGRILHTNPISMGFPAGKESSMVLDFATTTIAGTKVLQAQERKEQLPLGCIADKDGNPTTDPSAFFDSGGLLPFGGHKGYGLMMAAEALGGLFTGTHSYADPNRGGPVLRHQGVTMVVFKADLFQPFEDFATQADEFERRLRAIPPATGFKEVLVPGDLEYRTRTIRQREGIPIPDYLWRKLVDLAGSVGITDL